MSLVEAAKIDGANEWRVFSGIVMPNVKPAWMTLIIFSVRDLWNNRAGTFIYSEEKKTLVFAMGQIQGGGIARTGQAAAVMVVLMIRAEKRAMKLNPQAQPETTSDTPTKKPMPIWRIPIWIIAGLAGLIWGGDLFVESASAIARSWGVSEAVIAITLVAGGTSMPELASSLVSVLKGNTSLAMGNVLGSNIANILLILGACSTVTPLTMGDVAMTDIYIVVASTFVLMLSALVIGRDKLTRIEGLLFVACYVAYVYTLI